jgi:hypothetical protein
MEKEKLNKIFESSIIGNSVDLDPEEQEISGGFSMEFISMKSFVKEDEYDQCDLNSNSIIKIKDIEGVFFSDYNEKKIPSGIRIELKDNPAVIWHFKNNEIAGRVLSELEKMLVK